MSKIKVEYLDHMGTDKSVINSARVSTAKRKESQDEWDETDTKLIKYLAKHNHFSPFTHATAQFRVEVPIFVERQAFKSVVGLSYNSISGRYVEFKPDFYTPAILRKGSASIKQGSLNETIQHNETVKNEYQEMCKSSFNMYEKLLEYGVCREQARMVLPLSTMTEFIATGSLFAWARVYNLRSKPDAQAEIREYAKLIGEHMLKLFPISWEALTNA